MLYLVGNFFDFDYFSITKENWTWILVLVVYISIFGSIFELYDLQNSSKFESVWVNILLTTSTTVLFYLLTPFLTPVLPENRLQILYFFVSILVSLLIWRFAYINFITTPRFFKKALLVGETSNITTLLKTFNDADPNYKIVGFINCEIEKQEKIKYKGLREYHPKQIYQVIKDENISEIVVASCDTENITASIYTDLITLLEGGLPIKEYTQVYEELTKRVPVQFVGKDFYKYFPFSRSNQNKMYLFFHRLFDVILAILGIAFGVLITPIIVLANVIANRGPLFYTQERIGKNGNLFSIIKFRTMVINAEKNGAVWAKKNDARITLFGKFMRNTRIDEMPQFINVLKGDMSIIGPRPERPHFVRELSQILPFYETRHIVKPGLTGWAQVKTRYGSSVDDSLLKLQYDLFYIKHRSFVLDVNIFLKTLTTIIFFRGQ
jgi:exopolysaccharide biosynthesis polyprenyl glycosylphosphotransferase